MLWSLSHKTRPSHPRFASAVMLGDGRQLLAAERDQLYLMPPSLRDWLPDDHLALFVLDVVDELDLSSLYEHYRPDGLGRAAYEPSVMVAVLLYAYCVGERTSRRIERRCVEDIAFRVLAANQVPDHATIARFVKSHERALSALFCQVLVLCQEVGLVKLGVVALDGTKIDASASGQANRTRGELEAEADRILAEAIATDDGRRRPPRDPQGRRAAWRSLRSEKSANPHRSGQGPPRCRRRPPPGRVPRPTGRQGHRRPDPHDQRRRSTAQAQASQVRAQSQHHRPRQLHHA